VHCGRWRRNITHAQERASTLNGGSVPDIGDPPPFLKFLDHDSVGWSLGAVQDCVKIGAAPIASRGLGLPGPLVGFVTVPPTGAHGVRASRRAQGAVAAVLGFFSADARDEDGCACVRPLRLSPMHSNGPSSEPEHASVTGPLILQLPTFKRRPGRRLPSFPPPTKRGFQVLGRHRTIDR
jgi:hypothetical protein